MPCFSSLDEAMTLYVILKGKYHKYQHTGRNLESWVLGQDVQMQATMMYCTLPVNNLPDKLD